MNSVLDGNINNSNTTTQLRPGIELLLSVAFGDTVNQNTVGKAKGVVTENIDKENNLLKRKIDEGDEEKPGKKKKSNKPPVSEVEKRVKVLEHLTVQQEKIIAEQKREIEALKEEKARLTVGGDVAALKRELEEMKRKNKQLEREKKKTWEDHQKLVVHKDRQILELSIERHNLQNTLNLLAQDANIKMAELVKQNEIMRGMLHRGPLSLDKK